MEQAAPKQRSPWVYVALGCGGFALLSCLGVFLFFAFIGKKVSDLGEGVTNPKVRTENARKALGALPEGYVVAASLNVFGLAETTVLTTGEELPDGGVEPGDRLFIYYRQMGSPENESAKSFLRTGDGEPGNLLNLGVPLGPEQVLKRGTIVVDGRKLAYVAYRGTFGTRQVRFDRPQRGGEPEEVAPGLNVALLFECPGDALHAGMWAMKDPSPQTPATELDLTGTVADEAVLARFMKPMNPCGR